MKSSWVITDLLNSYETKTISDAWVDAEIMLTNT